jgi:hypothetical protein
MAQMIQFREAALRNGPVVYPITGDAVGESNGHVDHYDPTFFELADAYVAEHGGYDAFRVRESTDGAFGRRLADQLVEAARQTYHETHSNLRMVSKKANLSLLRRRSADVS